MRRTGSINIALVFSGSFPGGIGISGMESMSLNRPPGLSRLCLNH